MTFGPSDCDKQKLPPTCRKSLGGIELNTYWGVGGVLGGGVWNCAGQYVDATTVVAGELVPVLL